jgi:hypothetical protein
VGGYHALDVAIFHAIDADNVQIADDGLPGDAGYTTGYGNFNYTGNWMQTTGTSSLDNEYLTAMANSNAMATWAFTNLATGNYEAWASWTPSAGLATKAPYTVLDGSSTLGSVVEDQSVAPNDLSDSGTNWKLLGTFTITNGILVVELGSNANGSVEADGIRIQQIV